MRRLAFILSIVGLFILLIHINFAKPIEVTSEEMLSSLEENQKVIVSGSVVQERAGSNYVLLTLDNNIVLQCDCFSIPKLEGKSITALGVVDKFYGLRVIVLKLKWQ